MKITFRFLIKMSIMDQFLEQNKSPKDHKVIITEKQQKVAVWEGKKRLQKEQK